MAEDVRQLIYISNAVHGLSDHDIDDVLKVSRKNNAAQGITGMLLFADGVFVQALEGEWKTVNFLMSVISDDRRHEQIEILSDRTENSRVFGGWAMAYLTGSAKDLGRIAGIDGALNRTEALALLSGGRDRVSTFLNGFARTL